MASGSFYFKRVYKILAAPDFHFVFYYARVTEVFFKTLFFTGLSLTIIQVDHDIDTCTVSRMAQKNKTLKKLIIGISITRLTMALGLGMASGIRKSRRRHKDITQ